MEVLEIKQHNMELADTLVPPGSPFLMLNLLRYKPQADYGSDETFSPCTGRDAYFKRYIPAFMEMAAGYKDIRPFWLGKPLAALVLQENEKWDNIALIAYPDFQSFKNIVESGAYKKNALPHRLAALEDWKLMVTIETNPFLDDGD